LSLLLSTVLICSRSWESDLPKLDSMLGAVAGPNYPKPFFVGLFPEGTRITDKKREESWDFAEKNSLPRLHNVLLPRTKGFSHIADACRPVVDCVYDTTIAYEGGPAYIRHAIMEGAFRTQIVHVHIRRTEIKDLPTGQENLKQWLLSDFEMKDRLLEHFRVHNCFPGDRIYRPPATQV
jgi:1-acyl-sn-glycerol-3-phosphate acyltransferase